MQQLLKEFLRFIVLLPNGSIMLTPYSCLTELFPSESRIR